MARYHNLMIGTTDCGCWSFFQADTPEGERVIVDERDLDGLRDLADGLEDLESMDGRFLLDRLALHAAGAYDDSPLPAA